jgi:hypothetical protein
VTTLNITYTLTPGTPEDVTHVNQNYEDIRVWAIGF